MADFYGTVIGSDAYYTARGKFDWVERGEEEKLAALLIASEWLDGKYGSQYAGLYPTLKAEQTRLWPRSGATNIYNVAILDTVVPVQVENATYEVALRQLLSPGSLSKDWTPGQEKLSVAVSGAMSVTYAGAYSYQDAQVIIGGISAILAPVLNPDAAVSIYSARTGRV